MVKLDSEQTVIADQRRIVVLADLDLDPHLFGRLARRVGPVADRRECLVCRPQPTRGDENVEVEHLALRGIRIHGFDECRALEEHRRHFCREQSLDDLLPGGRDEQAPRGVGEVRALQRALDRPGCIRPGLEVREQNRREPMPVRDAKGVSPSALIPSKKVGARSLLREDRVKQKRVLGGE